MSRDQEFKPRFRRLRLRLQLSAQFARDAHGFERGACGAVGLGQLGLGDGAGVAGVLSGVVSLFDFLRQSALLQQEFVRRVSEAGDFLLRLVEAVLDLLGLDLRTGAAVEP